MEGYSSNNRIFDTYLKLPYMPYRKAEGGRVMEIGCGQGFYSFQSLVHGAKEVIGIERNPDSLSFAEKIKAYCFLDSNLRLLNADASACIHDPEIGEFDLVIMMSVLHQIFPDYPDPEVDRFLSRIAQITKYFSFESPVYHHQARFSPEYVLQLLQRHFGFVRLLYCYDAYSDGQRAIYSCYSGR